jgi:hypothetical protein
MNATVTIRNKIGSSIIPAAASLAITLALASGLMANQGNSPEPAKAPQTQSKIRVGVYNSRSVALAYYRSEAHGEKIAKLKAGYEKAKAAGDKEGMAKFEKLGPGEQDKAHRQVFGNAPIDDIMEGLKDALPEIREKAGVDKIAREQTSDPAIEIVDITSKLVEHFKPTKETLKIIEEMKKHPPLSDDKFPIKD